MSIKLLVVDDQPVACEGLVRWFADSMIKVVGYAHDGRQLHELFRKHRPDVVLLDWRLGEVDGLVLMEELIEKESSAKVIVSSGHDTPTHIARAAALGAKEFVRKSSDRKQLLETIEAVHAGRAREESLIAAYQASIRRRRVESEENGPLTNREIQVLRHVAMGLSNREIGKSLDISIETVKEHVQNILRKLDVNDRTQAAVWAVRRGLV
jgi:DNA-binding NarL/FixJ family response regulator